MPDIKSFMFYRSYWKAARRLPKTQQVKAIHAVVQYAFEGIEPNFRSANLLIFWDLAKPNIDAAISHSVNGAKGGRPPKNKKGGSSENKKGGFENKKSPLSEKTKTPLYLEEEEDKEVIDSLKELSITSSLDQDTRHVPLCPKCPQEVIHWDINRQKFRCPECNGLFSKEDVIWEEIPDA